MKIYFDHEKLDVYQEAIAFCGWVGEFLTAISSKAAAKDQLDRASTSIPLNIAEGNGKFSRRDRARFFQIAHGSALESAACLDLLVARRCSEPAAIVEGKALLGEIVRMLFKLLDNLGCRVAEDCSEYGVAIEEEKEEEEKEEGRGQGERSRRRRY